MSQWNYHKEDRFDCAKIAVKVHEYINDFRYLAINEFVYLEI